MTRAATHCRLLWDSAYIDQHGDVYACCHERPGRLGNIREASLASLWAGPALAGYRAQSASGQLACAPACTILSPEEKAGRPPASPGPHPRNLWLLWGELCNVACVMCPQDHRSQQMLAPEWLKDHVDWERVEEVELQGGEVLAMASAREFYGWLTEERGRTVNVITNGLLLTSDWARRLVRHGHWVQVSVNAATAAVHERVNAGSRFERAIAGLSLLVEARRANAEGAAVVFKFTIVAENAHEIPQAIRFAHQLGCDQIAFGFDRSVPAFLAAEAPLVERLRRELAEVEQARLPLAIERKRLRHLGLLAT